MAPAPSLSRTVVLTLDNLGAASQLQRGTWPADRDPASDPSLTEALPRLLSELDALGLRATFFVEAINCELTPDVVRSIAAAGHELGIHGYSHEPWAQLAPEDEDRLLRRSRTAYEALDLDAPAFRPPGGGLTAHTPQLLREIGCRWASPYGTEAHTDPDGFTWVPFDWELVDAYHLMRRFAPLRECRGDGPSPLSARGAAGRLRARLNTGNGPQTLILHPFLMLDAGWWAEVRMLLGELAQERDRGRIAIVPGGELDELPPP